MTPDQLPLTPAKQAQLQALLASAGVQDGLQACIDEAEQTVADYTTGYTLAESRTNGWTIALALCLAFTRSGLGVPEAVKEADKTARGELQAVRDGKFPGLLSETSPARSPGAEVTEDCVVDDTFR